MDFLYDYDFSEQHFNEIMDLLEEEKKEMVLEKPMEYFNRYFNISSGKVYENEIDIRTPGFTLVIPRID
jgi:hypothetical protein